jgi:hypothetical protein
MAILAKRHAVGFDQPQLREIPDFLDVVHLVCRPPTIAANGSAAQKPFAESLPASVISAFLGRAAEFIRLGRVRLTSPVALRIITAPWMETGPRRRPRHI